jgi:hypothetical protein
MATKQPSDCEEKIMKAMSDNFDFGLLGLRLVLSLHCEQSVSFDRRHWADKMYPFAATIARDSCTGGFENCPSAG